MTQESLYISFGPVQSFVSQARTTRDLWAGSSLLAILAENSLQAAVKKGAVAVSPVIPSQVSKKGTPNGGRTSVPNLMQVNCGTISPATIADIMLKCWTDLWSKICNGAWKKLATAVGTSVPNGISQVWTRQVEHVWYSMWAFGQYDDLRARKCIRDYHYQAEPGRKCTVCGEREALELSSQHKARLGAEGIRLDEKERLCAVCFIKRTLPLLSKDPEIPELRRLDAEAFPSTVNFACISWLRDVILSQEPTLKEAAKDLLHCLRDINAERVNPLSPNWSKNASDLKGLLNFNGNYFYLHLYTTQKLLGHNQQLDKARDYCKRLLESSKKVGIVGPSSYYAVLLMDGDNMGRVLSANETKKPDISIALNDFADNTYDIIEPLGGRVIYAGGDDLLAFLPIDMVLHAASDLAASYSNFMGNLQLSGGVSLSISAGITLANMNLPMGRIIKHTHYLLDDVAKEYSDGHTKKDAFAMQVWTRSGPGVRIVKKWQSKSQKQPWPIEIMGLVDAARQKRSPPLTKGFLYSASDLIAKFERIPQGDEDVLLELLFVEYFASRVKEVEELNETEEGRAMVRELVKTILELSRIDYAQRPGVVRFNKDAPLMIRFLASGGVSE